jgi:methylitaconate Delta-isomerase
VGKDLCVPCTIMRGGTSKGLFFHEEHVPADPQQRRDFLLRACGSPDVRQIDGLGGADPLTSKVAIIRRSDTPGVDVDYTFAQVSVTEPIVDFSANCGNISSAVGPYAIAKHLLPTSDPITKVRIFNTNTRKMIISEVQVNQGEVVTRGDFEISGVPGTGAEIKLHFMDPAGALTGKLLPTDNAVDEIVLENGKALDVSIVDAGNPIGFIRADQIGLRGDESAAEIESRPDVLAILEETRARVSERLGLCKNWRDVYGHYRSIPKIAFVSGPPDIQTTTSQGMRQDGVDLTARVMSMGRVHKAFAITAAIPTAAASKINGSVVYSVCRTSGSLVRIGHPSGVMSVGISASQDGKSICEVVVGRTARILMDGQLFLREG